MAKDGVTSCLAPLQCPWCHRRRGQEQLLPDVSCWVLRPQIPPGHGLENGPHGPSSSPSHHWRSLPHHELRPACRRPRRGRRGEGGHPFLGPGARLYSLHGLEEGLPVIWEGHDELQLGPTGLLHWKGQMRVRGDSRHGVEEQGRRKGWGTRADDPHGGQVVEEGGHQGVPAGVQLVAVDADVEFEPGGVGVVGRLPCREDRLGFTAADPAARQPPPPQQQRQRLVGTLAPSLGTQILVSLGKRRLEAKQARPISHH